MRLDRSSPAGLRFFSSLKAGRSLATSARAAGVGKGPAQRWVREAFNELREAGRSVFEAQASLGFISSSMPAWDHGRLASDNRHHLLAGVALVDPGVGRPAQPGGPATPIRT